MAVTELELIPRRMCSLVTKDGGEDPTGSVTTFDQLLVLELPLPWPRDVRAVVPGAVDAALQLADAAGVSYRLQAVVPDKRYTPDGLTRLIHVKRPAGSVAIMVYDQTDYLVPPERLGDLVASLVVQPELLATFAGCREPSTHIRDVLVCTHGTRDRCCGTFGYPVYNRLRRAFESDPTASSRVWRTSHLGGHRFAPTLLDLPDGRSWAHIDDEAVSRLERRDGPLLDLRRHYRGWAALGSEPEMIAERAIFEREGWAWASRSVRSEITSPTNPATGRTGVRLTVAGPHGEEPGYYDAIAEPTGVVTRGLGSCGDEQPREHRPLHVVELTKHELCRPRRFEPASTAAP